LLPSLHLGPIKVIVFDQSQMSPNLGMGFALICFQRLSLTNLATQQCHGRDNWYTRGWLRRVLSYCLGIPSRLVAYGR